MILDQFPSRDRFIELAKTSNVVPLCTQILADTETPVSILEKFYHKDASLFLLESVEGGEHWARYSFLGIGAHSEVCVFSDHVRVESQGKTQTIPHNNAPLTVLRKLTQAYTPCEMPELPRFWGGLTGYFTYEMVGFFEKIPVALPPDTPYARFIIPDAMVIFDTLKHTLTLVKIVYLEDNQDRGAAFESAKTDLDALLEKISVPKTTTQALRGSGQTPGFLPLMDPATYIEGVKAIKKKIVEGEIIQAVFSQPYVCKAPVDPVTLYRAQRYINPSPYMFFMNFKGTTIAGSSPETMVRLEGGTATLRPIAGTRPRGATEQTDRNLADELLKDEKERAEHLMLVDLGRNDLGRVAETGSVQVTELMVVERYSHVMHLVSNIRCDLLEDLDAWDLLRATFPAGTLSGAPKVRAMEILAALENRPRGIYGGAAGYISFSGNMDLAITIRTAVIEDDRVTVQAGAGIVADSDPQKELEECRNKAKSVERAMSLALKGGAPC
ncbi:TrpE [Desulforapulum autotrophicum HRM2]|uniref:Anthranilate synthase component 1 n=1 Tax=Desulforapulum autotrophicum (strain ATCC 43914 / DSM 3382 / VKM B-1955 / HRM2) TaxID=177437 RepID=C0QB76_DESAH|nr:anthranilate synthase component I family protein [Desulforapulum autotrophicum]ACN14875.1 TrpE [Desulforapulum autotrophicum HRM2]